MMQELLNGTNVGGILGGERSKLSNSAISEGSPNAQSPVPGGASAASENLRCPRCDSSNTKFCYYNNYNLTQPRHFCKTCRRYWTKGGALRNVPIGGGCRKNKSTAIATVVGKSNSTGKLKTVTTDIAKSALFAGNFDHVGTGTESALASNPIIWPQNSHFLSLLRSNQNPNLGHLSNSIKDEGPLFGSSNWGSESSISGRIMNQLDPLSHLHVTPNSIYRNQTQAMLPGELQSNGYQELYQRLRSSTSCYSDHQATVITGNVSSVINPPSNSGILESAPVSVTGGELGFWNSSNLSWPTDLPTTTTNGAYP